MADISKFHHEGSGTVYNLKDAQARNKLESVSAKVDNKLTNCDLILDTSFSASGIINIPTSKAYSFYTIIIEGDSNNGITFTIPKYVMDNYNTPFYLNVASLASTAYTAKADGQIHNNKINVASVSLTGWTQVSVYVFGVY